MAFSWGTARLQAISGTILWLPSDYRELAKFFAVTIAALVMGMTWAVSRAVRSNPVQPRDASSEFAKFARGPGLMALAALLLLLLAVCLVLPYKRMSRDSFVAFTVDSASAEGKDVVELEFGGNLGDYLYRPDRLSPHYHLRVPSRWLPEQEAEFYIRGVQLGMSSANRSEAVEAGLRAKLASAPVEVIQAINDHQKLRDSIESRGFRLLLLHTLVLALAGAALGLVLDPVRNALEKGVESLGGAQP